MPSAGLGAAIVGAPTPGKRNVMPNEAPLAPMAVDFASQ